MWQYTQIEILCKPTQKKLKFKTLSIELQRIWILKCTIVPVIIGATGIVTRSLKEKFGNCTRKAYVRFTTKNNWKSHIIRKVLHCESSSLNSGNHRWF